MKDRALYDRSMKLGILILDAIVKILKIGGILNIGYICLIFTYYIIPRKYDSVPSAEKVLASLLDK